MKTWETSKGCRIVRLLSGRSNVFLLTNNKKYILIDTGPAFMWKRLDKRLQQSGVNKLDYLILTHTHYDHAENAWRIREKYKARVIVHKSEAEYLTSGENVVPQGTNPYTRILVRLFSKIFLPLAGFKPCRYDYLVDNELDLKETEMGIYILNTPGHTSGSMSVIVDNEVAVVGDTMFGVFKGSVFPPFADDIKQMVTSWGRLLETGCTVFLPSHGTANCRLLVQKDYEKRIISV